VARRGMMPAFELTVTRSDHLVVVRLSGEIDDDAIRRTERVVTDLVEDPANLSVAVEFAPDADDVGAAVSIPEPPEHAPVGVLDLLDLGIMEAIEDLELRTFVSAPGRPLRMR
jgi:hypothetical protein